MCCWALDRLGGGGIHPKWCSLWFAAGAGQKDFLLLN
jgi:hypothetical protein